MRLKENFVQFDDALSKVMKLRGVEFIWSENPHTIPDVWNTKDIGFIAQEIIEVVPELGHTLRDGILGVKYQNFIALLSDAIQEQNRLLEKHEIELQKVEQRAKEKGLI